MGNSPGIYIICNAITGKVYVGSALNIERRFRQHRFSLRHGQHHSILLQRAWNKYGEAAFTFDVAEIVQQLELLVSSEQRWMDDLHSTNPSCGYNVNPLAQSRLGCITSVETRLRQSESAKKRRASAETRAKMSAALRGKVRTPETRARMSAAQKLAKSLVDPAIRSERARHAMSVRLQNPDFREQMAALRRGSTASAETRAKMSRSQRGSRNGCAKLTEQDVLAIREALANGATKRGLGREYGVSKTTIQRVALGTNWRHV